jgi:signal peptidase I
MMRLVRVSGDSMAPTYRSSDLLLTRRVGRAGPRRGDVVVLRHGALRMIKRVVAGPGDLVELEAGRLFVEGRSVDGRRRVRGASTQTWRVPAAHWFVVGDHQAVSDDSRVWEEPFVATHDVEAVVVRRLPVPRLPRPRRSVGLRPRRPAPANPQAA